MYIQRRRITANADVDGETTVAPEASDLLFEAEDVAELVAEVTGEPVDVSADDDTVTFAVGEDEYTVEAEGDEEILEAVRRPLRNKRAVAASRRINRNTRNTHTRRSARPLRKMPKK